MKVKYPIISFADKVIHTNFVQGFLRIFRDTQDTHRVLAIIPLTIFISHSVYMYSAPQVRRMAHNINNAELLWLTLCGLLSTWCLCWAVFSSEFKPSLYVRQIIFAIWSALGHRWLYGLETPGTMYLTVISIAALTSYLPYAFWGLRPDQLYSKVKEEYKTRKNAQPAVVTVPEPPKTTEKTEDAAA